ncbi:hypothetical protein HYX12_01125 [Candidatus Woesearchaeota archaeon]|nr:hypothetical protein [Candidatus Woesearchaeota archaeon]
MPTKLLQLREQKLDLLKIFGLQAAEYFTFDTDPQTEARRLREDLDTSWTQLQQKLDPERTNNSAKLAAWARELHTLVDMAYQQLTEGSQDETYTTALTGYVENLRQDETVIPHFQQTLLLYLDAIETLPSSTTDSTTGTADIDYRRKKQELVAANLKVGDLERRIIRLETTRDELLRRADRRQKELEAEKEELSKALETEQEKNGDLVTRYDQLSTKYHEDTSTADRRIQGLEQEKNNLSDSVIRISAELGSIRQERDSLESRTKGYNTKISELERSQEETIAHLQSARAISALYFAELTSLQQKHAEIRRELKGVRRSKHRLEHNLEEAQNDHTDSYARAKRLERVGQARETEFREYRRNKGVEIARLSRELAETNHKYHDAQEDILAWEGRLALSGEQLQTAHKDLDEALRQIVTYETKIQEEQRKFQESQTALQEKDTALRLEKVSFRELEVQYTTLRDTHEHDLQVSREAIDGINRQLTEKQGALDRLEEAIRETREGAAAYRLEAERQIQAMEVSLGDKQEELDLTAASLLQANIDVRTQHDAYASLHTDYTRIAEEHTVTAASLQATQERYKLAVDSITALQNSGVPVSTAILEEIKQTRSRGEHQSSLYLCEMLLSIEPGNQHATYFAGTAHLALKQYDAAKGCFEQLPAGHSSAQQCLQRIRELEAKTE